MKLTKSKKQKILIISLAVLFLAMIIVWFAVIKPLTEEQEQSTTTPVVPEAGESTLWGNLSLYPQIELKDVISLSINNEFYKDEPLEFVSILDPDTVTRELRLKNYPTLQLDDTIMANVRVPVLMAGCISNTPMRNATLEQMQQYGVTADTCIAKYTIKFYSGANECSYTVYVGDKSPNTTGSYFVSVEGRSVIYELSSILEGGLLVEKEALVSPEILSMYTETEAVYNVKRIMIGLSTSPVPYIGIDASKQELDDSVNIKHKVIFPQNAVGVAADTSYVTKAFSKLLVSFTGDRVEVIDPTEEQKIKYGVHKDSVTKIIYIDTFGANGTGESLDLGITISQKQTDENSNSYYYLLTSKEKEDDVPIIIRIPAKEYEFLEEENAVRWVATNSIDAGFYKYIYGNEQANQSGVKDIEIMINTSSLRGFHDKFTLMTTPRPDDETKTMLTVTSQSGLYSFVDDLNAELSSNKNQFNNFYAMLVNYPMPNRFNTMSEEERAQIKQGSELLLSIRVTMKDGTELGYDYYKIDAANVMCEFFDESSTEPRVVFDTTVEHINILGTALKQLINGEVVERK